ncbi:hypothetical protein C8R48DRAFT_671106 [Suillus tomentosus]|nr:hypothetical protein C8R48DRAFT_671106 [Suillus tomentosus]
MAKIKENERQKRIYDIYQMASEVFNTNGSMGAMPKKVITQADYFWAQYHATAAPTATAAPESQIGSTLNTLSGVAQDLLNAATETVCAAARLMNRFRRRTLLPHRNLYYHLAFKVAENLIPEELHAVPCCTILYHH